MAPPTKLTPEVHKKIIDSVRAGNYFEVAAAYAGVSKTTFYDWLRKGRVQKTGAFKKLVEELGVALGAAEVRDVATIAKASETHWQAAAWRLERKFPDRWGKRQAIQVSESSSLMETQEIDLTKVSTEDLETLERILTTKKPPKPVVGAAINEGVDEEAEEGGNDE